MIQNDDIFDAMRHVQRRRLLVDLLEDGPQHVLELSRASREMAEASDTFLEQYLSSDLELEGVDDDLLRLHHVHLPHLTEHGYVEWSRDAGLVRAGPRFDEVRPLLELLADRQQGAAGPETVYAHR